MKIQIFFSIIALTFLLTSCAPAGTQALPTATTSQTAERTSTFTPSRTETPTSTPTETPIAVKSLTGQLLFDMYHTGKVEYSELSDVQRRELAEMNRDKLAALTPDTVTGTGNWGNEGQYDVGLTNDMQWKRTDLTDASEFVGAADKLAPIVAACYQNQAGEVVIIGPNGEEHIVPRFNVDGPLAGKTILDIARMGQADRQALAEEMMYVAADAEGYTEQKKLAMKNYFEQYLFTYIAGFIDPFYQGNRLDTFWPDPNNPATQKDSRTNIFDVPLLDEKGNIVACARIHQSASTESHLFDFTAGQPVTWKQLPFMVESATFGQPGDGVALIAGLKDETKFSGFQALGGNGLGGHEVVNKFASANTFPELESLFKKVAAAFTRTQLVIGDLKDR